MGTKPIHISASTDGTDDRVEMDVAADVPATFLGELLDLAARHFDEVKVTGSSS